MNRHTLLLGFQTRSFSPFIAFVVSIAMGIARSDGQTITILHTFSKAIGNTNSDGANLTAGLVLSGDTLYGAAYFGGAAANGTIFKVKTDGTDFAVLHNFSPSSISGLQKFYRLAQ